MPTSMRELQSLLTFDDGDLAANRKGKLSKAQIEYLRYKARQDLKMAMMIPFLVVAGLMTSMPFLVAFPATILIGGAAVGFIALHKWHLSTLADVRVTKLSGQLLKLPPEPRLGLGQYVITIDGKPIAVDRDFYESISEGKFTMYMLDRDILCMEPLRKPTASKKKPTSSRASSASKKKATPTKSQEKHAKPTGKAPSRSLQRTRRS